MPKRCLIVKVPEPTPFRRSPRLLQLKTPPTALRRRRTSRTNREHPISDYSFSSAPRFGSRFTEDSRKSYNGSRTCKKSPTRSERASKFSRKCKLNLSASPSRISPKNEIDCRKRSSKAFKKVIEGFRRSTRFGNEVTSLADVHVACYGLNGSIHCNGKSERGSRKPNVVGTDNMTIYHFEASPVTPVGVGVGLKKFRDVIGKDMGNVTSGPCAEFLENSERRIMRSCSRRVGGKVKYGKTKEIHCNGKSERGSRKPNLVGTDKMAMYHFEDSPVTRVGVGLKKLRDVVGKDTGDVNSGTCAEFWENSERRITRSCSRQMGVNVKCEKTKENKQKASDLFNPESELRKRSYVLGKESRIGSFGTLVCGLKSNGCDSLSLCNTPGVRKGRQCKVKVNHEKDCKANECGQIGGNSERRITRSASKLMAGRTDLCGQVVERRGSHISRVVAGKTEYVKTKKEKLEKNGSLKCLISEPEKRIPRSSATSFSIRLEEEAGKRDIDVKENECYDCCGLDYGGLDKVSRDALSLRSTPDLAERKIRDDISKDPKLIGVKRKRKQTKLQGTDQGWTNEQEVALQRAYFTAKPSPHFWKKVAKLIPGKSPQECFDKVHSDNLTPISTRPSSRAKKWDPPAELSFSGSKLLKSAETKSRKSGRTKQKNHVARRTVRHLLQKCYVNEGSEADLFSVLEPMVDPSVEDFQLQSTPKQQLGSPGSSSRYHDRSSLLHKKCISRFSGANGSPLTSPPVLKKVKNLALHEKYIDQLHSREARRKVASARYLKSVHTKDGEENPAAMKDVIRAAKDALVSDARDVIHKFQHSQTNIMEGFSDSEEFSNNDDEAEEITV